MDTKDKVHSALKLKSVLFFNWALRPLSLYKETYSLNHWLSEIDMLSNSLVDFVKSNIPVTFLDNPGESSGLALVTI